jgi:hypothetical protein
LFEDKALAEEATMKVEKQIHHEDNPVTYETVPATRGKDAV